MNRARSHLARHGGFTLVELMVCVTIASLLASAMGAFLLQHRALCRAVSVDGEQERVARLILDHLRRDARVTSRADASAGKLTFTSVERQVTYHLGPTGLQRQQGLERTRFPMVSRFEPHISGTTLTLQLDLVRDLAMVRRQRRVVATVALEGP